MQLPPSLSHAHTFSRSNNSDLKCTAAARWRKNKRKKKQKKKQQTKKQSKQKPTLFATDWGSFSNQRRSRYFALLLKLMDRCSVEFLAFIRPGMQWISLHGSCRVWFWMSGCSLLKYPPWSLYLIAAWLGPRETAAVSAQVLCAPYNHAPVYSVASFKTTYAGCMCV